MAPRPEAAGPAFPRMVSWLCLVGVALLWLAPSTHAQCTDNVGCFPATEDLLIGYPTVYPDRTIQVSSTCGSPGPGQDGQLTFNRLLPNDTTELTCTSSEHGPATMTDRGTVTVSIPGTSIQETSTVGVATTYWQSNNTIASQGATPSEEFVMLNFTHPFLITEVSGVFVAPEVSRAGPNGTDARPLAYIVEKLGTDGQWQPWRAFSQACNEFPNIAVHETDGPSASAVTPVCTRRFFGGAENSDPYQTNETYYNAYQFDFSPSSEFNPEFTNSLPVSEYYVTTAVRLRLVKPVGVTPLTSYYAIADITVVGSCYCNGHASTCAGTNKEQCVCEHNTQGATCNACLPLYNNKAWRHGTLAQGNACEKCSCNDLATSCHYDEAKGQGVCDDCSEDSTGDSCEDCLPGYTVNPASTASNGSVVPPTDTCTGFNGTDEISYNCSRYCIPCNCSRNGTVQASGYTCNSTTGACQCKENVQGDKCDACKPSFFNLDLNEPSGCTACSCDVRGSLNVTDVCSAVDGTCQCKNNTRGRNCDSCKPESYDLRQDNPDGCTPCGCDPGAALNNSCAVEGGQCACRANLEGRDCRQPKSGFFVPKIDHFRFEAEFQSENVNLTRVDRVGDGLPQGTVTGRGLLSMSPGNQITFTLDVPITANYDVVLRFESQGQATLSGEVTMIGGAAYDCGGANIAADQTWPISATAQPAASRGYADLTTVCMKGGDSSSVQQYRMTLTLDANAQNDLLVDSVVLLPTIDSLGVVNATAEQRPLLENCRSSAKGVNLPARENCSDAEFSIMAEFFNGAPPCGACNVTGTEPGSVCAPVGGRCPCREGVTLPLCQMCAVDSYGLDLATGCIPCRCHEEGSVRLSCNESGVCECRANVTGVKCDACLPDHFGLATGNGCTPCTCSPDYAVNNTCQDSGQCLCKPGVGGLTCDVCQNGFYNLTSEGCTPCGCHQDGSASPTCHKTSGVCTCKSNVQGDKCDTCKAGYFGVGPWHADGCLPCFCSGHSANCSSASGWFATTTSVTWDLTSDLAVQDRWTAVDNQGQPVSIRYPIRFYSGPLGARTQYVMQVSNTGPVLGLADVYFLATQSFLGDKRSAYGQHIYLHLTLSDQSDVTANASQGDVILKGAYSDFTLVHTFGSVPGRQATNFTVALVEGSWQVNSTSGPQPTYVQFLQTLAALQSLRVRAKFSNVTGAKVELYSAAIAHSTKTNTSGQVVNNVEMCNCQPEFMGEFCEECSQGFRRLAPGGGPHTACTGCTCNGHQGGPCDSESGVCNCTHNTQGDQCQECMPGFHGDATAGTPGDCTPCMCPGNVVAGELNVFADTCDTGAGGSPVCSNCTEGHVGERCESCQPGYYGQPTNVSFYEGRCQQCQCNGRADTCNATTGMCEACRNNTAGKECDICAPGFFGDAMTTGCQECNCTLPGATGSCDHTTGQCECRPNVQGFRCDRCVALAFNYSSGQGCTMCDCHPSGATAEQCDTATGQCTCRSHVIGRRCDVCEDTYWNINVATGCDTCNCNTSGTATIPGSTFGTCDIQSGQCTCKLPGIVGRKCDGCSPISKSNFTFVRSFYSGTFPQCELCGECFDSWGAKLDALGFELQTLDSRTQAVWSNYDNATAATSTPSLNLMKQQVADAASSVERASNITSTLAQLSDAFLQVEEASSNVSSSLEELRTQLNASQTAMAELTSFDGSVDVDNVTTTTPALRAILTELTNQINDAYRGGNSSWVRINELSALVGNTESSRQQLQDRVNRALRLLEVAKQTFNSARTIANGTFREGFQDNQNGLDLVNSTVASAQSSLDQVKAILVEVTSQFRQANETMTSVIQQSSSLRATFSGLANQSRVARDNASNAQAAGAQAQTQVNRFKTLADSALANITSQLEQVVEAIESLVAAQADLSDALQAAQNTINVQVRDEGEMTTLANQIRATLVSADDVTATNQKAEAALAIAQTTLNQTEAAIEDSRRALQQVQGIQQSLSDAVAQRDEAQTLLSQAASLNSSINSALARIRGGNESSARASDVTTTTQTTTSAALAVIDRITATTQCLRTRESQAEAVSRTAAAAKQDSAAASTELSAYLQLLGSLSQASADKATSGPLTEITNAQTSLTSMTSALGTVEQIADLTALLQEYADQRDELAVLEQEVTQLQTRLDQQLQTLQLVTPASGCDVN